MVFSLVCHRWTICSLTPKQIRWDVLRLIAVLLFFCVLLCDNLIYWSSQRQHAVSRSSDEAKYKGVANVVVEAIWLENFLLKFQCHLSKVTVVFLQNEWHLFSIQSCITLKNQPCRDIFTLCIERLAFGDVRVVDVPYAHSLLTFLQELAFAIILRFQSSLNSQNLLRRLRTMS